MGGKCGCVLPYGEEGGGFFINCNVKEENSTLYIKYTGKKRRFFSFLFYYFFFKSRILIISVKPILKTNSFSVTR